MAQLHAFKETVAELPEVNDLKWRRPTRNGSQGNVATDCDKRLLNVQSDKSKDAEKQYSHKAKCNDVREQRR